MVNLGAILKSSFITEQLTIENKKTSSAVPGISRMCSCPLQGSCGCLYKAILCSSENILVKFMVTPNQRCISLHRTHMQKWNEAAHAVPSPFVNDHVYDLIELQ